MAYVVTESCIRCKYMDCVEVCPVDCFHEGPDMLVINPDECIDCNLCVPECPVNAIFSEYDIPSDQQEFIQYNLKKSSVYPVIHRKKTPPHDAEHYKDVPNKRSLLDDFEHSA